MGLSFVPNFVCPTYSLFSVSFAVSFNVSTVFFPARRIRSLPISHMFLYPALYASLFSSHNSGSCTMINLRFPPSSAFNCITAWAVVAEPEKKSRIMSSFRVHNSNKCFTNSKGLEKSNILFRSSFFNIMEPLAVVPISSSNNVSYGINDVPASKFL